MVGLCVFRFTIYHGHGADGSWLVRKHGNLYLPFLGFRLEPLVVHARHQSTALCRPQLFDTNKSRIFNGVPESLLCRCRRGGLLTHLLLSQARNFRTVFQRPIANVHAHARHKLFSPREPHRSIQQNPSITLGVRVL